MRSTDWATTVHTTAGGWAHRNGARANARHSWDLSFAVRKMSDYSAITAHFHQARGQVDSFPFRDILDEAATQANGVLTLVTGSTYQMHKRYGSGSAAWDRKITRPVSPATIWRTREGVTSIITPTVVYTTGRVTVSGHVSGDTYAWAGKFVVPCRYATDTLPGAVIDRRPGGGEHLVQCESILITEDAE